MTEPKKCGCGLTKDMSGNCDGSHTTIKKNAAKETPYKNITIRCISLIGEPQKVKWMYPAIVNNKQLMRTVGFAISDPNYDKKMKAFKEKRPYIENGMAESPMKESFAPKVETPPVAPVEKVKRTRRTKAEMAQLKQTNTTKA